MIFVSRLCRQYLECSSFGIEWLDERYGMCTIYNGVINITKLVDKDRVTLYSKLLVSRKFKP